MISSDRIDQFTEDTRPQAELAVVYRKVAELTAIAKELFGEATVEITSDPEIEDSHSVVFSVLASGDPREVANRRREWYRRTASILGEDCGKVQLLIDITE